MVTTEETIFATKSLGLRSFPSLVLFRNGDPLLFKGDITDEDEGMTQIRHIAQIDTSLECASIR